MSRWGSRVSVWCCVFGLSLSAGAQEQAPSEEPEQRRLGTYLEAMAEQRLIAEETGSADALQHLVALGEGHYFDGRYNEAALVLYEVVESPRFADFVGMPAFAGAELMLAGSLAELGSLRSAARYLEQVLRRGSEERYFAPAFRRFVDVALESGLLSEHIAMLDALEGELPEDATSELAYLRGRAAYDEADLEAAETHFAEVTRRSRFFANAQYFRGVAATYGGDLERAEAMFCTVAGAEDQGRYSFYVDDRYFRIKDLAWTALGRVAHEGRRSHDAFYYYFQVPADSERVAEALFEAAFAMYEGGQSDVAVDLLEQLDARFPGSAYVDEALILRGYLHLEQCEFDEAEALFIAYQERFAPVLAEIDAVLGSPTRSRAFYRRLRRVEAERLREPEEGEDDVPTAMPIAGDELASRMLALLQVDPAFHGLHSRLSTLEAEAARAGHLPAALRGLAERLGRGETPAAAAARQQWEGDHEALRRELELGGQLLAGNARQIDALRRGGASPEQLSPLEADLRRLEERLDGLAEALRERSAEYSRQEPSFEAGEGAEAMMALLREDARQVARLPRRVRELRRRLQSAAQEEALRALGTLREGLAGRLRRSRIGRIDAVMGSKRRIEIQIEALAAGEFPRELMNPLQVQGLLRESEEYWPFEGEYWADEFQDVAPSEDDAEEQSP